MLYFLLTVIAAWVVWQIVRYEVDRRRAARALRPAAGVALRGEQLEQWKRAQAAKATAREDRIREILKSTPWHMRGAMRAHLEKKISLGYDI